MDLQQQLACEQYVTMAFSGLRLASISCRLTLLGCTLRGCRPRQTACIKHCVGTRRWAAHAGCPPHLLLSASSCCRHRSSSSVQPSSRWWWRGERSSEKLPPLPHWLPASRLPPAGLPNPPRPELLARRLPGSPPASGGAGGAATGVAQLPAGAVTWCSESPRLSVPALLVPLMRWLSVPLPCGCPFCATCSSTTWSCGLLSSSCGGARMREAQRQAGWSQSRPQWHASAERARGDLRAQQPAGLARLSSTLHAWCTTRGAEPSWSRGRQMVLPHGSSTRVALGDGPALAAGLPAHAWGRGRRGGGGAWRCWHRPPEQQTLLGRQRAALMQLLLVQLVWRGFGAAGNRQCRVLLQAAQHAARIEKRATRLEKRANRESKRRNLTFHMPCQQLCPSSSCSRPVPSALPAGFRGQRGCSGLGFGLLHPALRIPRQAEDGNGRRGGLGCGEW